MSSLRMSIEHSPTVVGDGKRGTMAACIPPDMNRSAGLRPSLSHMPHHDYANLGAAGTFFVPRESSRLE